MRAIRGFVVVVLAVLVAASCSSDPPPKSDKPSASAKPGKVEVEDAVFVLNPDKSATLSAKVANGTHADYMINETPTATSSLGAIVNVRFATSGNSFPLEATSTIGSQDNTEIRLVPAPVVGTVVSIVLDFRGEHEELKPITITIDAPVVARTAAHDSVISSQANTKIKVKNGKVVVIAGQPKAYVSGTIVATIEDRSWSLPTAVDAKGKPVKYRHQTSTGGPYGLISLMDREFTFGGPPYTTHEGDDDYFDAKDVTVGEKLTITFPFESGDVTAIFTVVAG